MNARAVDALAHHQHLDGLQHHGGTDDDHRVAPTVQPCGEEQCRQAADEHTERGHEPDGAGERTEDTLGHIAGGVLDGLSPKAVVIMIGTNNIGHFSDEKPEWTAAGVKKIIEEVRAKLPKSKVLLLGVFPRDKKGSAKRVAVEGINAIISKYDDGKTVRYLDITGKFLDAAGEIPKEIMPDGLHPNADGYKLWADAMKPLLDELMK